MRAEFLEEQPSYRYFSLKDNKADVIIYVFKETVTRESMEGTETIYVYETESFKVDSTEVTEDDIAADPESYLTYEAENNTTFYEDQLEFNIDVDFRVSMLELGI